MNKFTNCIVCMMPILVFTYLISIILTAVFLGLYINSISDNDRYVETECSLSFPYVETNCDEFCNCSNVRECGYLNGDKYECWYDRICDICYYTCYSIDEVYKYIVNGEIYYISFKDNYKTRKIPDTLKSQNNTIIECYYEKGVPDQFTNTIKDEVRYKNHVIVFGTFASISFLGLVGCTIILYINEKY